MSKHTRESSVAALTPVEKARLDLQNDIVEYTQMILDKKHTLNNLAPTGVLPPELLAEVFMYLAHTTPAEERNVWRSGVPPVPPIRTAGSSPYAWIKVTHVCHHWREVALSAPQLWTIIWVTSRMECIKEMLVRSKQALLTVKADRYNVPMRVDGLDLVMRELPRIASFDARMPPRLGQDGQSGYSLNAPKLKELVLQTTDMYENLSLSTLHLQEHFANCNIPTLERVELYSYQIQWNNKLFKSSLKHLTLHSSHTHLSNNITLEQVLGTLENLPLLEYLDLTSCLPSLEGLTDDSSRIIELPKLRTLRIFSKASACNVLLKHIFFPANVSMTINCHLHIDDIPSFINTIRERFDHRSGDDQNLFQPPTLRTVDLRPTPHTNAIELRAWEAYHSIEDLVDMQRTLPEPFISVILRHTSSISPFTLFRVVPKTNIESLMMSGTYGMGRSEKAEWTRAFEQMPKLNELGLGEFAKDHVHQVLDHRVPCDQGPIATNGKRPRRKKQFCVPNLTVLRLQDFWDNINSAFLKRITKSLNARKKAKVGLKTLVLMECGNLMQEDADALEKFVDNVKFTERFRDEYSDMDEWEEDHYDDYGLAPPMGLFDNAFMPFPFGGLFDDEFMDSEDEDNDEEGLFMW
ncbi:hypothetical protein BDY19DRAFT_991156 [Irpex rosettiformis]|uniref:Uncharacterized protein n=1 Tax=Irpex rosettiformis TaxID=378272 RepID=A0ACB8UBV0_9APHY|nr:hypothetical protein BDY19DRAFT_991156 [Irpex rosettiformis]